MPLQDPRDRRRRRHYFLLLQQRVTPALRLLVEASGLLMMGSAVPLARCARLAEPEMKQRQRQRQRQRRSPLAGVGLLRRNFMARARAFGGARVDGRRRAGRRFAISFARVAAELTVVAAALDPRACDGRS